MPTESLAFKQHSAMPANSGRPVKLRQSCDACSAAKVKCTKEASKCSRCSANDLKCVYGESRRFGRVSSKKRTASRDSSSTEPNKNAAPVLQHRRQESGPSFPHNELWPELQLPFSNASSNTVNHGATAMVCSGDNETSMSGDKPNPGSDQMDSRQQTNPWAMPIDFNALPTNYIPAAQSLPTSEYGSASIGSETPPNFEGLGNRAKEPISHRASEALSEHAVLPNRNKQLGLHNNWNYCHPDPTAAAEPQFQDKISTTGPTLNQSDWSQSGQCDRCRSSAASSQPSADDIFRTNRIALQQVSRMLTCECGKDAQLAMLFASILQRVLAGYRTIIDNGTIDSSSRAQSAPGTAQSSPMTSLSNPPSEVATLPQRWDVPAGPGTGDVPVRYGSFSLDQGDVDLLRQTLAKDGLRRAEQVVLQMETLHGDPSANRFDSSGITKPDNNTSNDVAHVNELYKLLSGWLKADIRKTMERINSP